MNYFKHTFVVLTICLVYSISCFVILTHADTECTSRAVLKKHTGHYAEKTFWNMLPKVKIWAETGISSISAVDILDTGESIASYSWHEGGDCCVQLRGNEVWVKNPNDDKKNSQWVGPFIRVSSTGYKETPYFDRIFGNHCFKSNKNEQWCFGPGSIKVGTKRYKANIVTDTSEMPTYGTPVRIEGENNFWIFVPWGEGWKVFKDTFLTVEDRAVDPNKSTPWRKLKP